jgi:hypothetical protein
VSRARAACRRALALLVAAALPTVAIAGPHEHGVATLDVLIDGERLLVSFQSPLDNLAGFEHAPRNEGQRAALAKAAATLADGGKLFRPAAAAGCVRQSARVDMPFAAGSGSQTGAASAGPVPQAHGPADDTHSEAAAEWAFVCRNVAALRSIEVGLFDAFGSLRTLRVQTATPRGQSAATLTAKRRVLGL